MLPWGPTYPSPLRERSTLTLRTDMECPCICYWCTGIRFEECVLHNPWCSYSPETSTGRLHIMCIRSEVQMGPAGVHSVVYSPHSTITPTPQIVRSDNAIPHKRERRAITLILTNMCVSVGVFKMPSFFGNSRSLLLPSTTDERDALGVSKSTHRSSRIMWIP